MAEPTDQAVVTGTDAPAKPGTEAPDARKADDLDALLAEFDKGTSKPDASKPETKPDASLSPDVVRRLETVERRIAEEQLQNDLKPVISKIKEGLPPGVLDDKEIEDILDGKAKRDPRLAEAWLNRHKNPQQWDRVVGAIGRELSDRFKKLPDKGATEDREAVTAAVRGASTKPPAGQAPDYSKLSNNDFAQDVEKNYGFRPL